MCGGERLGLEGLAEDHLVDRLVDDLLEARHVRALLVRAEVDEALELGVEELLVAVRADADHLLDAGHADAREADVRRSGGAPGRRRRRRQCCGSRVGSWQPLTIAATRRPVAAEAVRSESCV